MEARFQHARWPSLGSIHVMHGDAGVRLPPHRPFIRLLSILSSARLHLVYNGLRTFGVADADDFFLAVIE